MSNIFSENITWSIGICIVLFGIIAAHRLVLRREKINKFIEASKKFRNIVLAELEGLYPATLLWDREIFPRFYQSIPKIESAAAEFRRFVKRKAALDAAVEKYNKYCRKITYEKISCLDYPSMRKLGNVTPRDEFINIVEHLLSFAEEK